MLGPRVQYFQYFLVTDKINLGSLTIGLLDKVHFGGLLQELIMDVQCTNIFSVTFWFPNS